MAPELVSSTVEEGEIDADEIPSRFVLRTALSIILFASASSLFRPRRSAQVDGGVFLLADATVEFTLLNLLRVEPHVEPFCALPQ